MPATAAQQRATKKYKDRKRAERLAQMPVSGRRKPNSASREWKRGSFPRLSAPPENHKRCSRCSGFGHTAEDHLDLLVDWGKDAGGAYRRNGREVCRIYRKPEFPEVAEGGSSLWRVRIFMVLEAIQMTPTKSFLRQTVEQIALLHRRRKVERSGSVDLKLIRTLEPDESLQAVRTTLPLLDSSNRLVGWKRDETVCEPLLVTFNDADDETEAA
jgi:hypothetical protein